MLQVDNTANKCYQQNVRKVSCSAHDIFIVQFGLSTNEPIILESIERNKLLSQTLITERSGT